MSYKASERVMTSEFQKGYAKGYQDLLDNLERMLGMPNRPTTPWDVRDYIDMVVEDTVEEATKRERHRMKAAINKVIEP